MLPSHMECVPSAVSSSAAAFQAAVLSFRTCTGRTSACPHIGREPAPFSFCSCSGRALVPAPLILCPCRGPLPRRTPFVNANSTQIIPATIVTTPSRLVCALSLSTNKINLFRKKPNNSQQNLSLNKNTPGGDSSNLVTTDPTLPLATHTKRTTYAT
jgi:hypothetical protein